jgi:hypothetical protein
MKAAGGTCRCCLQAAHGRSMVRAANGLFPWVATGQSGRVSRTRALGARDLRGQGFGAISAGSQKAHTGEIHRPAFRLAAYLCGRGITRLWR